MFNSATHFVIFVLGRVRKVLHSVHQQERSNIWAVSRKAKQLITDAAAQQRASMTEQSHLLCSFTHTADAKTNRFDLAGFAAKSCGKSRRDFQLRPPACLKLKRQAHQNSLVAEIGMRDDPLDELV